MNTGYIMILIAGFCWGALGLFVKELLVYGLNPMNIAFLRIFVGFIILFVYMVICKRELFKIDKKGLFHTAVLGFASQACFNICYSYAIEKTTISTAVVLLYTAPLFTTVCSMWVFKEKITYGKFALLILCITGSFFTVTGGIIHGLKINFIGVLSGLGAGLTYGLMPILGKRLMEEHNQWTILLYSFLFGSLFLIPVSNPIEIFYIPFNFRMFCLIIALGLIPTALSYICYFKGLTKGVTPSKASVISTIELIVAVLISFSLYHEHIGFVKIIGIFLVLMAVILIQKESVGEVSTSQNNE